MRIISQNGEVDVPYTKNLTRFIRWTSFLKKSGKKIEVEMKCILVGVIENDS